MFRVKDKIAFLSYFKLPNPDGTLPKGNAHCAFYLGRVLFSGGWCYTGNSKYISRKKVPYRDQRPKGKTATPLRWS